MKRSLVFALILSLGHASVAVAGETLLLQSARRITIQAADARTTSAAKSPALQAQPALAQTGMRKRTKLLIALGIALAYSGVAYAVDRGVEDNTPSSRGER